VESEQGRTHDAVPDARHLVGAAANDMDHVTANCRSMNNCRQQLVMSVAMVTLRLTFTVAYKWPYGFLSILNK